MESNWNLLAEIENIGANRLTVLRELPHEGFSSVSLLNYEEVIKYISNGFILHRCMSKKSLSSFYNVHDRFYFQKLQSIIILIFFQKSQGMNFGQAVPKTKSHQKTYVQSISQLKTPKNGNKSNSDEESFELEFHQKKRLKIPINKSKITMGTWNVHENIIYLDLLQKNKEDFYTEESRRKSRIFQQMSKLIKKRTPDQCRSHHQKLQDRYSHNLDKVIEEIKRKIENNLSNGESTVLQKKWAKQKTLQAEQVPSEENSSNSMKVKKVVTLVPTQTLFDDRKKPNESTRLDLSNWYRVQEIQQKDGKVLITIEIDHRRVESWTALNDAQFQF